MSRPRLVIGALCGIAAPLAFVAAWLIGGRLAPGYDPAVAAISQLAREGAPTRLLMTGGLAVFGILLPVWAGTIAAHLAAPRLRGVVTVAGTATLAVAAFPLTQVPGGAQDGLHSLAALVAYGAMAATPIVAAVALRRGGRARAAAASLAVGLVSAVALAGSIVVEGGGGLQRIGLTVVDAWHVVVATWVLGSGRSS